MEAAGFLLSNFFIAIPILICRSCIWLCDFMFYNTCILFFDLFLWKVLGLNFFYYKVMIFFKIFFGLFLEFETDQASRPLAPPCPPNVARKDKEWMKVGSKWKCKISTCIITYYAKWLFTKHLKEVHGLVTEKVELERPLTSKGGPWHHDHAQMNIRILKNAMAMQRRNDQKVANCAHAKA
jgi:hypothetical protein